MDVHSLISWPRSWMEQLLFQRTPQQDGFSRAALALALSAYLGVDLLQAVSSSVWSLAWAVTLTDTAVMIVFATAVLRVAGRSERLVQTLTALAGTGVVLGVLGLPLVWQAARVAQDSGPPALVVGGWLVLLVWSVAVQAHIFRHALSTRYGYGLMLAGLHSLIAISMLEALFPHALSQGTG